MFLARALLRDSSGNEVRLRYAYFIKCTGVIKDAAGEIMELRATYDPLTKGGNAPDGRKMGKLERNALADLDLTSLPYAVRRDALLRLFDGVPAASGLHVSRATPDAAVARRWFADFEGAGLDGVVAKRTDAPYAPGQRTMLKIKHARTAEAVVIGYGLSRSGPGVGSLHLGLYDEGTLVHVGGIGALPDAARVQLADVLAERVFAEALKRGG